ncbi:MAG TPA: glycosyltransferase [Lacibacter sp.]|nr:glycosyltransferase [Lacibacter sp.]
MELLAPVRMGPLTDTIHQQVQTRVSIIICTYNRDALLLENLKSLLKQTAAPHLYEIIVVDNAGSSATARLVASMAAGAPFHRLRYYKEYRNGSCIARNRGLREVNSAWTCFMDDDALADSCYVEELLAAIEKYPDATGFGGKILPRYLTTPPLWMNRFVQTAFVSQLDNGNAEGLFDGKRKWYPFGCNMVYTTSFLRDTGGFDEDLGRKGRVGLTGDDNMIYLKAKRAGRKVYYLPRLVVYHLIEPLRLEKPYLRQISYAIGKSESIRTKKQSLPAQGKKLADVLWKMGASVVLRAWYLLQRQPGKAYYVLFFRYHILIGFLR